MVVSISFFDSFYKLMKAKLQKFPMRLNAITRELKTMEHLFVDVFNGVH